MSHRGIIALWVLAVSFWVLEKCSEALNNTNTHIEKHAFLTQLESRVFFSTHGIQTKWQNGDSMGTQASYTTLVLQPNLQPYHLRSTVSWFLSPPQTRQWIRSDRPLSHRYQYRSLNLTKSMTSPDIVDYAQRKRNSNITWISCQNTSVTLS